MIKYYAFIYNVHNVVHNMAGKEQLTFRVYQKLKSMPRSVLVSSVFSGITRCFLDSYTPNIADALKGLIKYIYLVFNFKPKILVK